MTTMQTPRINDPVRYKTTMCKNWEKTGSCPYHWRCQFAHGAKELRSRNTRKTSARDSTPITSPVSSARSSINSPCPSPPKRDPNTLALLPTPRALATPPPRLPPGLGLSQALEPLEPEVFCEEVQDESESAARHAALAADLEAERRRFRASSTDPYRHDVPAASPAGGVVPRSQPAAVKSVDKAVTFAPIELVARQGGSASRFAASQLPPENGSFVPDHVRALWDDSAPCESPLRCNGVTGKVEAKTPKTKSPPWLLRRMSSAGELVRRTVSFVLEESSRRSTEEKSEKSLRKRFSLMSRRSRRSSDVPSA